MATRALRLGFVRAGGAEWIAGRIYLENIVRALATLPADERPEVCVLAPAQDELGPVAPLRPYTYRGGVALPRRIVRMLLGLRHGWPISLQRAAQRAGTDVVLADVDLGRGFPLPWLAWIPDLQHRRLPEFFSAAERRRRDSLYEHLVAASGGVVVSSRDAKNDLERWFPAAQGRIGVLSFCTVPDPAWFDSVPRETAERFGLPEKYLILPAQFWAHKDHATAFEAMRLLKERGLEITLVCTGATVDYRWPRYHQELVDRFLSNGSGGNVRILGLLPRAEQVQLLRGAAALVQPSLFEGWSAVVEDARALGKRTYVSDLPVHREQEPSDAVFFRPKEANELADAIAADWAELRPGPLPQEELARAGQEKRTLAFARRILEISADALGRA